MADLNHFLRARISIAAFTIASFVIMFSYYMAHALLGGILTAPPQTQIGDQIEYDTIAVQVAKMRGFARDWDDPDYKRPYEEANADGGYDLLLKFNGHHLTTYRPPALPVIMAATFRLFGRQFWAARTVNAAVMAGACALAARFCFQVGGPIPALVCLALLALNSVLTLYSADLLTENLACLGVAAMALTMLAMGPRCSPRLAVQLGVIAGLSILTRTVFALWLPGLAILVYMLCRSRLAPVVFLACALAVPLPWFVRNCIVLDAFMPLGVQGMIELPAGFSDEAVKQEGTWTIHRPLFKDEWPALKGEHERQMAEYGKAQALAWIKAHPKQLLPLALSKIQHEWHLSRPRDWIRLSLCLLFLLLSLDLAVGRILLGIGTINTLVIAATWSVDGRFNIPILPLVGVAASLGIWTILVLLTDLRQPIRRTMGLETQVTASEWATEQMSDFIR